MNQMRNMVTLGNTSIRKIFQLKRRYALSSARLIRMSPVLRKHLTNMYINCTNITVPIYLVEELARIYKVDIKYLLEDNLFVSVQEAFNHICKLISGDYKRYNK